MRPNRYPNLEITWQNVDRFYVPLTAASFCAVGVDDGKCAYGLPAIGSLGSAGIGAEGAPSLFDFRASIGQKFNTEKQYFDFRVELFNAFNDVSFANPARDITSPNNFGQITRSRTGQGTSSSD